MTRDISGLIDELAGVTSGDYGPAASGRKLLNQWSTKTEADLLPDAAEVRRARLLRSMSCYAPELIIVRDAGSIRDSMYTGVPWASELALINGLFPRVPAPVRITTHAHPVNNTTSFTVAKMLMELSLADSVLMWDLVPWIIYRDGADRRTEGQQLIARSPDAEDFALGERFMRVILEWHPEVPVVGIGAKAVDGLRRLGVRPMVVRSPQRMGIRAFREQMLHLNNTLLRPIPEDFEVDRAAQRGA